MKNKRFLLIGISLAFLSFLLVFATAQKTDAQNQTVLKDAYPVGDNFSIIGTKTSLYYWNLQDSPQKIWSGASIKKVLRVPYGIFLLTSKGVVFTKDLSNFESRNTGFKYKVIKHYKNGKRTFSKEIQDLKDLEADPFNPAHLVSCSKDYIYYSFNRGKTWKALRNPTHSSGIKSVAIYSDPEPKILVGHAFRGLYYKNLNRKVRFRKLHNPLTRYSEEVSDIVVKKRGKTPLIYVSHNFTPKIFRLKPDAHKKWTQVMALKSKFAFIDSLFLKNGKLSFVSNKGLLEYSLSDSKLKLVHIKKLLQQFKEKTLEFAQSIYTVRDKKASYAYDNLWVLYNKKLKQYAQLANKKRGIYLQASVVRSKSRFKKTIRMMRDLDLNMITIDMKDDYGRLRFKPTSPLLKKMGSVRAPVNLKKFRAATKKHNIWLVARVVVFKDRHMYRYRNGRFAVKDKYTKQPWRGFLIRKNRKTGKTTTKIMHEHWVDPYSAEIWEYNIEIARDLLKQGFDEIQFDYIRFPTDGKNLYRAYYPFRNKGMDKESALISFLTYARENIAAPISIDIYGSNGYYRTSARTGQDVEILQKYVDAICPMYYPSHFAQSFMRYKPAKERTYRIYYFGSLRNYFIAKKNVIIRPWTQAFKINVSYDRRYYGPYYVKRQTDGIKDSINMGYTFWNSASRYSILLRTYFRKKSIGINKSKEETKID